MNNNFEVEINNINASADTWFNQWVEEMVDDFEQVELDEFILMD